MKISINDKFYDIKTESLTTLQEIVEKSKTIIPKNHVLTNLNLNSKDLDKDWKSKAASIYILEEDNLEITTTDSQVVGQEALEDSIEAKEHILNDLNKIADMFRMDDPTKANKHFSIALSNLHWFLNIIQDATILLREELNDIKIDEIPFKSYIAKFSKKLNDILATQENEDWVLLADMIEYEMIPELEKIDFIYNYFNISK